MVGIVHKVYDAGGNLVKVTRRRLFGRRRDILQTVKRLKLGCQINTSHIERINGTMRTQQPRLARRTRNVSHKDSALQWALSLWRDLYHWTRRHNSLGKRTPAMAQGLATRLWTVRDYVCHPVHFGEWQRSLWAERHENRLINGLNKQKPRKLLPAS